MKKFLKKIFLFLGVILLINFGLKLLLNKLYFNDYNQVYLNAHTYLLADSHGAVIGEFKHDSVYNFSSPSDSYIDIETKLNYLIRHSKVERILLTVDEHTLSPYRKTLNNSDRSVYYSSLGDFSNFTKFTWDKYVKYNLVILNPKYGPIIKNYFKSILVNNSTKEKDQFWNQLPQKERRELSLSRFDKQFAFKNSSKELSNSLERIVALCKSNNIEIIGIKFPISKEYRETIGDQNYESDSILSNHNYNIYNFNSEEFSDSKYFKDQDHLNTYGAEQFKKAILDSLSY